MKYDRDTAIIQLFGSRKHIPIMQFDVENCCVNFLRAVDQAKRFTQCSRRTNYGRVMLGQKRAKLLSDERFVLNNKDLSAAQHRLSTAGVFEGLSPTNEAILKPSDCPVKFPVWVCATFGELHIVYR